MSERKIPYRMVVIALGIIIVILTVSLLGTIDNNSWAIESRDRIIQGLQAQIEGYEAKIESLNSQIYSLTESFFIQDPNFTITLDKSVFWGVEAWNRNDDSVCEISNGILHLFYNETIGSSYGNSGVFQGMHTYGGFIHQLLVGYSSEIACYRDYLILPRDMPNDKLWLETNLTITRMGFNRYPIIKDYRFARVNLGVTLMCAINDQPLNLTGQNLWFNAYFAGYFLNETSILPIQKDNGYANQTGDIHAGYFVGEVAPQDFGKWVSMRVDLGYYINKTLHLIDKIDITTIRVYGIILFVECLGAYAEVEYDYVRTTEA